MSHYVAWMLELKVQDGKAAEFRSLMAEMARATQADEPGTLNYEWHLSADGSICHLYERYADSAAAMIHIGHFGEKFSARFMAVLQPTRLVLYGSPDAGVTGALAGFGAVIMTQVDGFHR